MNSHSLATNWNESGELRPQLGTVMGQGWAMRGPTAACLVHQSAKGRQGRLVQHLCRVHQDPNKGVHDARHILSEGEDMAEVQSVYQHLPNGNILYNIARCQSNFFSQTPKLLSGFIDSIIIEK